MVSMILVSNSMVSNHYVSVSNEKVSVSKFCQSVGNATIHLPAKLFLITFKLFGNRKVLATVSVCNPFLSQTLSSSYCPSASFWMANL